MKTRILIIAVLISFGAKAQMSSDSIQKPRTIGFEYMLIDTFENYSGDGVDSVWYSETLRKEDLPIKNIGVPIVPNNDTTYRLINSYRIDYLSSLKIVAYQKTKLTTFENIEKPIERQMFDFIRKGYQLGYTPDQIRNHPKVKAITNE